MDSWSFPEYIEPFSKIHVYVEWDENIFHDKTKDTGDVQYVMDYVGGHSFQIRARFRYIEVLIETFTVPGHDKGSTIDLGWIHDGFMIFVLAGPVDDRNSGEFLSTGCDLSNWMNSQKDIIGDKTLRQLCMGGSHDAGMSVDENHTVFGVPGLVLTQTQPIRDQLTTGARYFDIRPIIGGGKYFTGHYSHIDAGIYKGFQGGRGQPIQEIVDQLNHFTSKYSGEVIILSLSHTFNTDLGNEQYRALDKTEWDQLIQLLKGINHLFTLQDPKIDLTTIPMTKFLEAGTSIVVVVIDKGEKVQLGGDAGKGFFLFPDNFHIYDKYANTYDVAKMEDDQLRKMSDPASHLNKLFLLSWTCTPQDKDIAKIIAGVGTTVLDKAAEANQKVCDIFQRSTRELFPNIILTDRYDSNVTAIAIAINYWLHLSSVQPAKYVTVDQAAATSSCCTII